MGDRALIIFKDKTEVSPVVYLHWMGSEVPELLKEHKKLMTGREDDLSYAAARFVGICHAKNADSNTGLGMFNLPEDKIKAVLEGDAKVLDDYSHGDAGVVVVDAVDFSWKAYGGYLSRKKAA